MAGEAGYNFTLLVATTQSGSFSEISSQNGSFNRTADILDDTDTTNAGYHTRLVGLLDSACSADFHWSATDTAYGLIEAAYEGRSELWVKVLPDGQTSNGKKFQVVIESFNTALDVTGLVTVSASFQGTGAVVADDA